MKFILIEVCTCVMAGLAAYYFLDHCIWIDNVDIFIIVHSLLAAAILFRLGRYFPVIETTNLAQEEIDQVTDYYDKITRQLVYMISSIGVSLLILLIIKNFSAQEITREIGWL